MLSESVAPLGVIERTSGGATYGLLYTDPRSAISCQGERKSTGQGIYIYIPWLVCGSWVLSLRRLCGHGGEERLAVGLPRPDKLDELVGQNVRLIPLQPGRWHLADAGAVVLLHPPLTSVGVPMGTERGRQQNMPACPLVAPPSRPRCGRAASSRTGCCCSRTRAKYQTRHAALCRLRGKPPGLPAP